jgi:hypothetical protein
VPGIGLGLGGLRLFQGQCSRIIFTEGTWFIAIARCQALFLFLQAAVDIPAEKRGKQARLPAECFVNIRKKPSCFFLELRIEVIILLHGPDGAGVGGTERCGLPGKTVPNSLGVALVQLPTVQENPDQAQQTGAVDLKVPPECIQQVVPFLPVFKMWMAVVEAILAMGIG